ncbi:MAG: diaminopimelate decarboxylase [Bryobacteraceae bacterium]
MPGAFHYRDNVLYCEDVELSRLAARAGTPCYVYSAAALRANFLAYEHALEGVPHRVCYAVKANGNLAVLRLLAGLGSGFDIVSGGELFRVLKAGGDPSSVVFAGVGKTREEIEYALESGIHSFNCESEAELALISSLAVRLGTTASVAVRVNPDVDALTHPYISTGLREHKFGIDIHEVENVYERARALPNLSLDGVSCHIGSQLLDLSPLIEAVEKMVALALRLRARGFAVAHLDLGGSLGVPYRPEEARPDLAAYLARVRQLVEGHELTLVFEPGRWIAADAGALLARVLYRKRNGAKEFIVVDAAMNDLIRPALYQAWHEIVPLRKSHFGTLTADIVGPICETGDFLARDREVASMLPGDLLAVLTAGAYGFVEASNYNSRPRACEVLVDGASWRVVRRRESREDLIRGEE